MTQPIDSQNLFSKTVEVQKMQQNLQNQSTNQTAVFAEQLKKSTDEKEVKTSETEETIMQQGGDGKERGKKKRKKGQSEGDDDNPESGDGTRGRVIDVKI